MKSLMRFSSADVTASELLDAMKSEHAVVVENLLPGQHVAAILSELQPFIDGTQPIEDDFVGRSTTRTGALVTRSPTARRAVVDPLVLDVASDFLAPFASNFQLNLTQIMRILPGEKAQGLHRDRYLWSRSLAKEIEPMFNSMWALTDFTEENGATRVVSGSQHWDWDQSLEDSESTPAEMPAGSVLLYSGSIVHGGGANRSTAPRIGMSITYLLSWLRQEENQYLSCPPEIARELDPKLQELLGYTIGNGSLGYFSPAVPASGHPDTLPPELALGRGMAGDHEEQKPF